jgi:hypothetical protein
VQDAVRALRDEGTYNGKLRFYVITVDSKQVRDEVAGWQGLGSHGLVGTTAQRELKVVISGHDFGRNSVIEKANELLAATAPARAGPP